MKFVIGAAGFASISDTYSGLVGRMEGAGSENPANVLDVFTTGYSISCEVNYRPAVQQWVVRTP